MYHPRYLSKSRFKLALECLSKLYYTGKKSEYEDANMEDPFLEALAKGGFQVGELAKYYFSDEPNLEGVTVNTLSYEESLRITNEKLAQPGKVVIAEAAFRYQNLFIRADIVVKESDTLYLYEVKAKSANSQNEDEESFLSKKGGEKISKGWVPYLYDIAFQKHVIENSEQTKHFKNVKAHLLLADKDAFATVEGLNQKFKIIKEGSGFRVEVPNGLTRNSLGNKILKEINLDNLIEKIWNEYPVPVDFTDGLSFYDFVEIAQVLYSEDKRQFTPIGAKCKNCQFIGSNDTDNKKSGFHECWKHHTKYSTDLLKNPLVTELWGGLAGSRSLVQEAINSNTFLLRDVTEAVIAPKNSKSKDKQGLTPTERRMLQVNCVKDKVDSCFIDILGLKDEMSSWVYPLHMIDFETSMAALPFHTNHKPYEGIAFQFSHHVMYEDGRIEHAGQFLEARPGVYPNFDFVRELKKQLSDDRGSIFRYHNHENSYLNMIAAQLESLEDAPADKDDLVAFIRSITRKKTEGKYVNGERDMIDLYDLVIRYYYSPFAKGSNSLKQILPSIIRDSDLLREKYGKPGLYGKNLKVKSLNFDDHIWIPVDKNHDPYKTLPSVFNNYTRDELDDLVKDFDELGDGGAALTAYNYLQFGEVPDEQRQSIAQALLRYCELDTMAMIMIVEGWKSLFKSQ